MIPGGYLIYQCFNCEEYLKNVRLASGNTLDSIYYSDGKKISPNLPELQNLIKCKNCKAFIWLNKTKCIGSYEIEKNIPTEWINAGFVEFLNLEDYLYALEANECESTDNELYIRIRILWLLNDKIRDKPDEVLIGYDSVIWRKNIENILSLLEVSEKNNESKILSAELFRNLGDFNRSIKILNTIDSHDFEDFIRISRKACESRNSKVFRYK